jgi:hypothetical protein
MSRVMFSLICGSHTYNINVHINAYVIIYICIYIHIYIYIERESVKEREGDRYMEKEREHDYIRGPV